MLDLRVENFAYRAAAQSDYRLALLHHEDVIQAFVALQRITDVLLIAENILLPVHVVRLISMLLRPLCG
ncbi:hypothetical protein D3C73_1505980 [compost metagenome]